MTMLLMDILDAVMSAPPDSPAWGLMICEATRHGPSSIYPALERLLKAGWIKDEWEEQPRDRPRRRFYTVTGVGREAYREAATARAGRRRMWAADVTPSGDAGWGT
jgi:PadR family transcriptional regulator PadR